MRPNSTLEIDLNIIRDNYATLKQLSVAEVGASVKANSYGLGVAQITETLISCGCTKFFVADIIEGIELRNLNNSAEIFVLKGIEQGEEEYFLNSNLTAVINNLDQLELLNNFYKMQNQKANAILHVETGLNRLAMLEKEVAELQGNKDLYSHVNFEYIMSHLASSEEQDNSSNKSQLDKFKTYLKAFPNSKGSLVNSAGVFLDKEYHYDLVRPGAAIYGINLNEKMSVFRNPLRLFSRLIQIKEVQLGESLGYNHTHSFEKNTIVGTIPIGYGDGIFRSLSNKGHLYINDFKVPIIGRVSMDLINLDLTNLPERFRSIGQEVDIICASQSADELAKVCGTIGYEVITHLGNRIERKYLNK